MQYDAAMKVIVEMGKDVLLRHFLQLDTLSAELIEEIPQETVSLRRSDFPLRICDRDGSEKIVLLEFQTSWATEAVWRLMDYAVRFKLKYRLPVIPAMLLLREHPKATGVYRDECFEFRFHLVQLWEQRASEVLAQQELLLLPLVPVMDSNADHVLEAERRLYDSELLTVQKADLLTALTIFAGIQDVSLAQKLLKRRRDIMIQSPTYDLIRNEGIAEGIERGIERGVAVGLRKAIVVSLDARFGAEGLGLARDVEGVEDWKKLEAVERAILAERSLDEIREIIQS